MRRKIRYAFKSPLIISARMMAEGFDLPVGEGRRECGRKGCSSTSASEVVRCLFETTRPRFARGKRKI